VHTGPGHLHFSLVRLNLLVTETGFWTRSSRPRRLGLTVPDARDVVAVDHTRGRSSLCRVERLTPAHSCDHVKRFTRGCSVVLGAEIESGLQRMPAAYRDLLARAVAAFDADDRVRGMWLHGAIARSGADAGSDLDIDLAVRDSEVLAFAADQAQWLAQITPVVSLVPLAPASFYALTPTCERMDVITEPVSALPSSSLTRRLVVFDRDNLTDLLPPPVDPAPDRAVARYAIEETIRQAANFPVVVVRQDWLLGVVAVQQIHQHLYLLFCEANKPQPPTGPKQWSFKLSPRHRAMLEALPVPQPNLDSILEARQAALALLLTEGRAVAGALGVEWPAPLEQAVLAYLVRAGFGIRREPPEPP
jgi:hypothetical protein